MTDEEQYAFILKKDTWNEFEINKLFAPQTIPIFSLIRASIQANTLTPIGMQQFESDGASVYCFKPGDIMEWAIDKEIEFPDKLREWYDKQSKPKPKEAPAYLDTAHPLHSTELSIAISAWEAVLQANPDKPKKGSRKQLIESWLRERHPELKETEINRITTMLNPDKAGGAPKTE